MKKEFKCQYCGKICKSKAGLVSHKRACDKKGRLTLQQERFCILYASDKEFFGNGVQSYAKAYNKDLSKKSEYSTCRANASILLTNTDILGRINEILDDEGLNDPFVDKQLKFLLTQDKDLKTKLGAIKEYNKLKSRILKKLDVTSGGEKLKKANLIEVDLSELDYEKLLQFLKEQEK